MKRLKSYLLKARSVVSIKTYKRPMIFVILIMIALNVLILAIAAMIAVVIDDSYTSFMDAFANGSVKWMLTPNAILDITNTNTLILAVIVLIIGMILFSGTIIALTTNLIKDYFQSRRSGSGRLYLSGHVIILNWNNKVPELVADLMHIEGEDVTVAILADVEKSYAEKQIINAIHKNHNARDLIQNLNVLVKEGDPLIASDLQDISIEQAISVIIMNQGSKDEYTTGLASGDLNIIKIILNIGRVSFKTKPPIVAEIKQIQTKQKIATMQRVVTHLQDHQIMPICFDRRLGQIIAQTIIHNNMEDVYLAMFSFEGSEVYYLPDTTFEECIATHTDCVPLAHKDGGVFVLSKDDTTIYKKASSSIPAIPLTTKSYDEATSMDVYVIGRNNKLEFMLDAFSEYEKLYGRKFQATWIEEDQIATIVDMLQDVHDPVTIVLLSDEHVKQQGLDANVIDNLIFLEGHLHQENINVIVELLDPKNDLIIKDFNINNTIISNKIVSLLLSKLALYPDTESFYENLLTLEINEEEEDDQEVFIRSANELLDMTFPLSFASQKEFVVSIYEAFHKTIIPFGIIQNGELFVISDQLHKQKGLTIEAEDLFVLMKL